MEQKKVWKKLYEKRKRFAQIRKLKKCKKIFTRYNVYTYKNNIPIIVNYNDVKI